MAGVILKNEQDKVTAMLTGEIDHHSAQILRMQIDECIAGAQPSVLVMDFSGVSFMDSSGIGLILGRHKVLSASGGIIIVQNAPKEAKKMLNLAGIQAKEGEKA